MDEQTEHQSRERGRPSVQEAQLIDQYILRAALKAFNAYGFDAAQMEAIARDAGVSKPALYRRFKNKAALLVGVVGQLTEHLAGSARDLPSKGNTLDDLRMVMAHYRERAADKDQVALQRLVIGQIPHQAELIVPVEILRASYVAPVDDLICAAIKEGLMSKKPIASFRELLFDLLVNDVMSLALFGFSGEANPSLFDERWELITKVFFSIR